MNLPNRITLSRIILIPVFILAVFVFPQHLWISAIIFAIASLTDLLDGYIARKYNLVTTMGKFLDPIADKVLVLSALLVISSMLPALLQYNVGITSFDGYIIAYTVMAIIIIAREIIIGGFRQIAASKDIVIAADSTGKIKTVVQDLTIIMFLISPLFSSVETYFPFVMLFLAVSTVLSVYGGIMYIVNNSSALRDDNKKTK